MTFVNGSNLFTAFKHLDLYIDDYEDLYHYLFEQTVEWWRTMLVAPTPPAAQHVRVYWHVVDSMDEWDVGNPKTRQHLYERFQDDREVHARWLAEAGRLAVKGEPARLEQTAFNLCLEDGRVWYEKRQAILGGMNRFHHAVESATDFIELCRCGRWKVDLLHKTITERGLDVCFAVDLIGLMEHFDVAILIGADPDGVASLDYLKRQGKQIAVIELLKGSATEFVGRGFATPLKLAADFVVPIYEMELVKRQIATKGSGDTFVLREAS
jgi:hypothetical protein